MTIGWVGPISPKKYGGIVYNDQAREFLSKTENIALDFIEIDGKYFKNRYLKAIESLFYLSRLKGKRDLWIRDFYSTITLPFDKTQGKNLVVIHHVDFSGFPLVAKPFLNFLERIFFYRNLKKVDGILTISEYWKNHFLKNGYRNIYKIYPSFDLSRFDISDKEVSDFRRKYNLEGKPIIYIGNCQRAKGVVESYRALKDLDVNLVTSGRRQVKIPARNFDGGYRDYLKLLKASSVVIIMSKFKEGWCMTGHEAMLLKIPVIGSGQGGMRELLEGGKQIICSDFKSLREKTEYLLKHPEIREKMGQDGYSFARNFTIERSKRDWLNLVRKI